MSKLLTRHDLLQVAFDAHPDDTTGTRKARATIAKAVLAQPPLQNETIDNTTENRTGGTNE